LDTSRFKKIPESGGEKSIERGGSFEAVRAANGASWPPPGASPRQPRGGGHANTSQLFGASFLLSRASSALDPPEHRISH